MSNHSNPVEAKVGFTGTRYDMTDAQRATVGTILLFDINPSEFHHGACKGADATAAALVRHVHGKDVKIVAHPGGSADGTDNEWLDQASVDDADFVSAPTTHFARNRFIADLTDVLIAAPKDDSPQPRGGTWYTVDYATKKGKPVLIVYPDGHIESRNAQNTPT